jgi:hypothetical protein
MTAKFAPSLQELALVEWLLAAPEKRFAAFYNSGGMILYERDRIREEDGLFTLRRIVDANPAPEDDAVVARFGGKLKLDPWMLHNAGLVVRSSNSTPDNVERQRFKDSVADIWITGTWSHGVSHVRAAPSASAWWNTVGRARHEMLLAKLAAKKAAVAAKERVAIFGKTCNYTGGEYSGVHADAAGRSAEAIGVVKGKLPKWRGMRPAFSAVIARETDSRYYLKDIRAMSDARLDLQGGIGRNVERYVDKDRLILDHATEDDIERMKEFDRKIVEDYVAMRDRLIDEMVPSILASLDRSVQKAAEIDDTWAELLSSMSKGKTN